MKNTNLGAPYSTPVVILGACNHGALGIARSVGSLGAPVYVVDDSSRNPTRFSRYCRRHYTFPIGSTARGPLVASLLRIATEIGRRSVLIPTTDQNALFVADNAGALSEWYILPNLRPEVPRQLADKYSMAQVANRLGIPTPTIFRPRSRSEVIQFCDSSEFPVVMKPTGAGLKKYIVRTADELLSRYDEIASYEGANLILQEYIPGDETTIWMFNGYFNADSECLFGATGQKIRQCPVYTGSACLAVCRANRAVYDTTVAFMKALGYCGILDIGYRYDARDGTYKVLDVNPRIGCSFRLFVSESGMDVARAMYLDLTGQPVPPAQVAEGRRWVVEDCDLVSSVRYANDGVLTFSDWFRSFRGVRETAFVSIRDPLPALAVAVSDVREAVRRVGALCLPTPFRRASRDIATVPSSPLMASHGAKDAPPATAPSRDT
ncbi:MAG TPA: ATP-grasp domain-containing protein [Bryobacteraceae bacterium]|nr:ATP-grasp domain-containing protein [Bryobacteraceae bacterium]